MAMLGVEEPSAAATMNAVPMLPWPAADQIAKSLASTLIGPEVADEQSDQVISVASRLLKPPRALQRQLWHLRRSSGVRASSLASPAGAKYSLRMSTSAPVPERGDESVVLAMLESMLGNSGVSSWAAGGGDASAGAASAAAAGREPDVDISSREEREVLLAGVIKHVENQWGAAEGKAAVGAWFPRWSPAPAVERSLDTLHWSAQASMCEVSGSLESILDACGRFSFATLRGHTACNLQFRFPMPVDTEVLRPGKVTIHLSRPAPAGLEVRAFLLPRHAASIAQARWVGVTRVLPAFTDSPDQIVVELCRNEEGAAQAAASPPPDGAGEGGEWAGILLLHIGIMSHRRAVRIFTDDRTGPRGERGVQPFELQAWELSLWGVDLSVIDTGAEPRRDTRISMAQAAARARRGLDAAADPTGGMLPKSAGAFQRAPARVVLQLLADWLACEAAGTAPRVAAELLALRPDSAASVAAAARAEPLSTASRARALGLLARVATTSGSVCLVLRVVQTLLRCSDADGPFRPGPGAAAAPSAARQPDMPASDLPHESLKLLQAAAVMVACGGGADADALAAPEAFSSPLEAAESIMRALAAAARPDGDGGSVGAVTARGMTEAPFAFELCAESLDAAIAVAAEALELFNDAGGRSAADTRLAESLAASAVCVLDGAMACTAASEVDPAIAGVAIRGSGASPVPLLHARARVVALAVAVGEPQLAAPLTGDDPSALVFLAALRRPTRAIMALCGLVFRAWGVGDPGTELASDNVVSGARQLVGPLSVDCAVPPAITEAAARALGGNAGALIRVAASAVAAGAFSLLRGLAGAEGAGGALWTDESAVHTVTALLDAVASAADNEGDAVFLDIPSATAAAGTFALSAERHELRAQLMVSTRSLSAICGLWDASSPSLAGEDAEADADAGSGRWGNADYGEAAPPSSAAEARAVVQRLHQSARGLGAAVGPSARGPDKRPPGFGRPDPGTKRSPGGAAEARGAAGSFDAAGFRGASSRRLLASMVTAFAQNVSRRAVADAELVGADALDDPAISRASLVAFLDAFRVVMPTAGAAMAATAARVESAVRTRGAPLLPRELVATLRRLRQTGCGSAAAVLITAAARLWRVPLVAEACLPRMLAALMDASAARDAFALVSAEPAVRAEAHWLDRILRVGAWAAARLSAVLVSGPKLGKRERTLLPWLRAPPFAKGMDGRDVASMSASAPARPGSPAADRSSPAAALDGGAGAFRDLGDEGAAPPDLRMTRQWRPMSAAASSGSHSQSQAVAAALGGADTFDGDGDDEPDAGTAPSGSAREDPARASAGVLVARRCLGDATAREWLADWHSSGLLTAGRAVTFHGFSAVVAAGGAPPGRPEELSESDDDTADAIASASAGAMGSRLPSAGFEGMLSPDECLSMAEGEVGDWLRNVRALSKPQKRQRWRNKATDFAVIAALLRHGGAWVQADARAVASGRIDRKSKGSGCCCPGTWAVVRCLDAVQVAMRKLTDEDRADAAAALRSRARFLVDLQPALTAADAASHARTGVDNHPLRAVHDAALRLAEPPCAEGVEPVGATSWRASVRRALAALTDPAGRSAAAALRGDPAPVAGGGPAEQLTAAVSDAVQEYLLNGAAAAPETLRGLFRVRAVRATQRAAGLAGMDALLRLVLMPSSAAADDCLAETLLPPRLGAPMSKPAAAAAGDAMSLLLPAMSGAFSYSWSGLGARSPDPSAAGGGEDGEDAAADGPSGGEAKDDDEGISAALMAPAADGEGKAAKPAAASSALSVTATPTGGGPLRTGRGISGKSPRGHRSRGTGRLSSAASGFRPGAADGEPVDEWWATGMPAMASSVHARRVAEVSAPSRAGEAHPLAQLSGAPIVLQASCRGAYACLYRTLADAVALSASLGGVRSDPDNGDETDSGRHGNASPEDVTLSSESKEDEAAAASAAGWAAAVAEQRSAWAERAAGRRFLRRIGSAALTAWCFDMRPEDACLALVSGLWRAAGDMASLRADVRDVRQVDRRFARSLRSLRGEAPMPQPVRDWVVASASWPLWRIRAMLLDGSLPKRRAALLLAELSQADAAIAAAMEQTGMLAPLESITGTMGTARLCSVAARVFGAADVAGTVTVHRARAVACALSAPACSTAEAWSSDPDDGDNEADEPAAATGARVAWGNEPVMAVGSSGVGPSRATKPMVLAAFVARLGDVAETSALWAQAAALQESLILRGLCEGTGEGTSTHSPARNAVGAIPPAASDVSAATLADAFPREDASGDAGAAGGVARAALRTPRPHVLARATALLRAARGLSGAVAGRVAAAETLHRDLAAATALSLHSASTASSTLVRAAVPGVHDGEALMRLEPVELERRCAARLRLVALAARTPAGAAMLGTRRVVRCAAQWLVPAARGGSWDAGGDVSGHSPRCRRLASLSIGWIGGTMPPARVDAAVRGVLDGEGFGAPGGEAAASAAMLAEGHSDGKPRAAVGSLLVSSLLQRAGSAIVGVHDGSAAAPGAAAGHGGSVAPPCDVGMGQAHMEAATCVIAAVTELSRSSPAWRLAVWQAVGAAVSRVAPALRAVSDAEDTPTDGKGNPLLSGTAAVLAMDAHGVRSEDLYRAAAALSLMSGTRDFLRVGARVLVPDDDAAGVQGGTGVVVSTGSSLYAHLRKAELLSGLRFDAEAVPAPILADPEPKEAEDAESLDLFGPGPGFAVVVLHSEVAVAQAGSGAMGHDGAEGSLEHVPTDWVWVPTAGLEVLDPVVEAPAAGLRVLQQRALVAELTAKGDDLGAIDAMEALSGSGGAALSRVSSLPAEQASTGDDEAYDEAYDEAEADDAGAAAEGSRAAVAAVPDAEDADGASNAWGGSLAGWGGFDASMAPGWFAPAQAAVSKGSDAGSSVPLAARIVRAVAPALRLPCADLAAMPDGFGDAEALQVLGIFVRLQSLAAQAVPTMLENAQIAPALVACVVAEAGGAADPFVGPILQPLVAASLRPLRVDKNASRLGAPLRSRRSTINRMLLELGHRESGQLASPEAFSVHGLVASPLPMVSALGRAIVTMRSKAVDSPGRLAIAFAVATMTGRPVSEVLAQSEGAEGEAASVRAAADMMAAMGETPDEPDARSSRRAWSGKAATTPATRFASEAEMLSVAVADGRTPQRLCQAALEISNGDLACAFAWLSGGAEPYRDEAKMRELTDLDRSEAGTYVGNIEDVDIGAEDGLGEDTAFTDAAASALAADALVSAATVPDGTGGLDATADDEFAETSGSSAAASGAGGRRPGASRRASSSNLVRSARVITGGSAAKSSTRLLGASARAGMARMSQADQQRRLAYLGISMAARPLPEPEDGVTQWSTRVVSSRARAPGEAGLWRGGAVCFQPRPGPCLADEPQLGVVVQGEIVRDRAAQRYLCVDVGFWSASSGARLTASVQRAVSPVPSPPGSSIQQVESPFTTLSSVAGSVILSRNAAVAALAVADSDLCAMDSRRALALVMRAYQTSLPPDQPAGLPLTSTETLKLFQLINASPSARARLMGHGEGVQGGATGPAAAASSASEAAPGTAADSGDSREAKSLDELAQTLTVALRSQLAQSGADMAASAASAASAGSAVEAPGLAKGLIAEIARNIGGGEGVAARELELDLSSAVVLQSLHGFTPNMDWSSEAAFPDAVSLVVQFDRRTQIPPAARVVVQQPQGMTAIEVRQLAGKAEWKGNNFIPLVLPGGRIRVDSRYFPSTDLGSEDKAHWGWRMRVAPVRNMAGDAAGGAGAAGVASFEFGAFLWSFVTGACPEVVATGALHSVPVVGALLSYLAQPRRRFKPDAVNMLAQLLATPELLKAGPSGPGRRLTAMGDRLFNAVRTTIEGRGADAETPAALLQMLQLAVLAKRAGGIASGTASDKDTVSVAMTDVRSGNHPRQSLSAWPPESLDSQLEWLMGSASAIRHRWPLPPRLAASVFLESRGRASTGVSVDARETRQLCEMQLAMIKWVKAEDQQLARFLVRVSEKSDVSQLELTSANVRAVMGDASVMEEFPRLREHAERRVCGEAGFGVVLRCMLVLRLNLLLAKTIPFVEISAVTSDHEEDDDPGEAAADGPGAGGAAEGEPRSREDEAKARALASLGRTGREWTLGAHIRALSHLCLPECKKPLRMSVLEATAAPSERRHSSKVWLHQGKALQNKEARCADPTRSECLLAQLSKAMYGWNNAAFRVPLERGRLFQVGFQNFDARGNTVNEDGIDVGGLYRDTISQCVDDAFEPTTLAIFMESPAPSTGLGGVGLYVPNPAATSGAALRQYECLGIIMGIAIRTERPQDMKLSSYTWKRLLGRRPNLTDVEVFDERFAKATRGLVTAAKSAGTEQDEPIPELIGRVTLTVRRTDGVPVRLPQPQAAQAQSAAAATVSGYVAATRRAVLEFCRAAVESRLTEHEAAFQAMRRGIDRVVPLSCLRLLTWREFETLVCGQNEIDVARIRSNTRYLRPFSAAHPAVRIFWQALETFTQAERVMFIQFAWGRSRLPPAGSWSESDRCILGPIALSSRRREGGRALPLAHTCFFQVELPEYESVEQARDKLLMALHGSVGAMTLA